MSHDIEASYAATEVVNQLLARPDDFFNAIPPAGSLSGYAAREGRNAWPHADGVIELAVAVPGAPADYSIAVEFKRPNEGTHGILTAIGQSHAYLNKGYNGSLIVVPGSYAGLPLAGEYVREVLDQTSRSEAIGVFTYRPPDLTNVSPFAGKLDFHRGLRLDAVAPVAAVRPPRGTETQWAHVREGSTEPDAFFKYLQTLKVLGGGNVDPLEPTLPASILSASTRVRPGVEATRLLSNAPNNAISDVAWRHFWFKYILHPDNIAGWTTNAEGAPVVNDIATHVKKADGLTFKKFFCGRSDSIRNKLVQGLLDGAITVQNAEDKLVQNYAARAHSYREDIDSGCEHLGFVDSDGRLTDSGYKFVDACERYGNPNAGVPKAIFMKAVLGEGGLGAFLHYVHRLSEERFAREPLAFSSASSNGRFQFNQGDYRRWLEEQMVDRLKVVRKVNARGGVARKPFQAELAVLRSLGIVSPNFRIGVGMVINWPNLQDSLITP